MLHAPCSMAIVSLIGVVLLGPGYANAQTPDCEYNTSPANKTGSNPYKISYQNANLIDGLSNTEWKYQVLQSTEVWNANANGGWLVYDGDSTQVDFIPANGCTTAEKINLVRIGVKGDGICTGNSLGWFNTRCDGTQWMLTICGSNNAAPACTMGSQCDSGICDVANNACALSWHVQGDYSGGGGDLLVVMNHEFGHVLGLDHPTASQNVGVMGSSATGGLRRRALYPWDIECHERGYGRRSRSIRHYFQAHNVSTLSGPTTSASGYSKGMGNVRIDGGSAFWSTVAYSYRFRNSKGTSLSGTITNFNQQYVSGFTNAWFPDLPTRWRTMYNYDYDSANRYANSYQLNNIYQYAYDHDFNSGTLTQGKMYACTQAPPNCSPEPIYSYQPISVSPDIVSGRTVFAWVNANRTNDDEDRQIWISVGNRGSSERLLNVPHKLTIPGTTPTKSLKSSINVALACGEMYSAGGYDCVIVYSPITAKSYAMETRRFYVTGSSDNYGLAWGSTASVGWLTGSNVTAWFNNSTWWLAHTSGTTIHVRNSSNSTSWSHYSTLGAGSIGPPQAMSVGNQSNRATRLYYTER